MAWKHREEGPPEARGFFSSSHLLSICKSQIRPSLEYCFHVWGGAPKSTLCLLDKVQSKAIRLINNPNLTKSLQPLSHRRLVGNLSIFYRFFNGHCSQEIRDIIPVPLRRVRTTSSSTHSHPCQVSLPDQRTLSPKILTNSKKRSHTSGWDLQIESPAYTLAPWSCGR